MKLAKELRKKKQSKEWDHTHMHPRVFMSKLQQLDVDEDLIRQFLREPPETWETTLQQLEREYD